MKLTEENFLLYSAMHYTNTNCENTEEFLEDIKRISHIKKLLLQYRKTDIIKVRLILNHLVILYNVFRPKPLTNMLLFKLKDYTDCIIPFLKELNYLEWENIESINKHVLDEIRKEIGVNRNENN